MELVLLVVLLGLTAAMVVGSPSAGRWLLRRWDATDDPTPQEAAYAVGYLRRRRALAAGFAVPLLIGTYLIVPTGRRYPTVLDLGMYVILGSVLLALLLAEGSAGVRGPWSDTRTAMVARRRWRDLVPGYAVALHLGFTVLAMAGCIAGLLLRRWAAGELARLDTAAADPALIGLYRDQAVNSTAWALLVCAVVGPLLVYAVVRLAVIRPATVADRVDVALRMRSARVAVGLGIGLAATTAAHALVGLEPHNATLVDAPGWMDAAAGPALTLLMLVWPLGVLAWTWVANPPRRLLSRASP